MSYGMSILSQPEINLKFVLVVSVCLFSVQSVFIEISREPFCFKIPSKPDNTYRFFYQAFEEDSEVKV